MADLVGNRVVPDIEGEQLSDVGAGGRFAAILRALQITLVLVGMNGHGRHLMFVVLSSSNLLHLIIILRFVVDAVKVGDVDFKILAYGRDGVGTVLAVGDGLVSVEKRRPFSGEGQHGIVGVVFSAVDVQFF